MGMTTLEKKKQKNKELLLSCLEKSLGVVTTATKMANISRSVHYVYMDEDPEYKRAVEDIQNIALDFVESKLYGKIKKDDTTCIIFYMKTKGKNRGYVERIENKEVPQESFDIGYGQNTDTT